MALFGVPLHGGIAVTSPCAGCLLNKRRDLQTDWGRRRKFEAHCAFSAAALARMDAREAKKEREHGHS